MACNEEHTLSDGRREYSPNFKQIFTQAQLTRNGPIIKLLICVNNSKMLMYVTNEGARRNFDVESFATPYGSGSAETAGRNAFYYYLV